jgi:hypothetical protein
MVVIHDARRGSTADDRRAEPLARRAFRRDHPASSGIRPEPAAIANRESIG